MEKWSSEWSKRIWAWREEEVDVSRGRESGKTGR